MVLVKETSHILPSFFSVFNFQLSVFPEGKFHILAGFAHMTAKVDPQKP